MKTIMMGHKANECSKPKPPTSRVQCFCCGKEGHKANECSKPKPPTPRVQCFCCCKEGHKANEYSKHRPPTPQFQLHGVTALISIMISLVK
jgi:hypothetical protein